MLKSVVKSFNIELFDKENPPEEATLVKFYTDGEIALWCPDVENFVILNEGANGYALGYQISLNEKIRLSEEDIILYRGDVTLVEE